MFLIKSSISTSGTPYIAGFNNQHLIVTYSDLKSAKQFKSILAIETFNKKYSNCGYGYSCSDFDILDLNNKVLLPMLPLKR